MHPESPSHDTAMSDVSPISGLSSHHNGHRSPDHHSDNMSTASRPVEPSSLFVGRLHSDTRRCDLEDVFQQYGKIKRCELKRGGYAFVEFYSPEDARAALKEDGRHLLGESIAVMFAKARQAEPGSNGCFRCGAPDHWSRDCPQRFEDRGLGLPKWCMSGRRGRSRSHSRSRSRSTPRRSSYRGRSRTPPRRSRRRVSYSRSRSRSDSRSRSRSRSRSPYRSPYRSSRSRRYQRSRSPRRRHSLRRSSNRDRSRSRSRSRSPYRSTRRMSRTPSPRRSSRTPSPHTRDR